ncbi:MAG: DUF2283 domain-containing protein [Candidatus Melainabacteria bacterium]|nr:DUF2283 domain-containing protein [Candidatus Melainabacteria bacterium]
MKIKIDNESDAMYISFVEDAEVIESEEIKPGLIVDYNKEEKIVGIELVGIREKMPELDLKNISLETN